MDYKAEAEHRMRLADELFNQAHPDGAASGDHAQGCTAPKCHIAAHHRQMAAVAATLALLPTGDDTTAADTDH